MEPISQYVYKKGSFYLKSKWPRKIKAALAVLALVTTLTYVDSNMFAGGRTFADTRSIYTKYIRSNNPKVHQKDAHEVVVATYRWAAEFKIEQPLLLAIARTESNFDKHAISSSGALGLMQVIPRWHKEKVLEARKKLGNPELFNINTNIFLGAKVLSQCLEDTKSIQKALECYSGQTPGYAKKVLAEYDVIKQL